MGSVKVSDQDFEEKVLKAAKPVMVDFYADWCGPCKAAAPVIEEIAEEYADKLVVAKLDVDSNQETAAKYQVMSIPTVIFFADGAEVERIIGFGGREKYLEGIKKVV
jgi:thioredoxin 1